MMFGNVPTDGQMYGGQGFLLVPVCLKNEDVLKAQALQKRINAD